jgi:hypothetical protein
VLFALVGPAFVLGPGCGARSGIGDFGGGGQGGGGQGGGGQGGGGQGGGGQGGGGQGGGGQGGGGQGGGGQGGGGQGGGGQGGGGQDAGPDAPVDAPEDSPVDAPEDSPVDAPEDAPFDAPIDAPEDAPFDAPEDAPFDAPIDAPVDAPIDAPVDAPSDAGCTDADGDGYSVCDGDCDDGNALVNPGAFDFPNGLDDDCSGGVDDPFDDCDGTLEYTSQDPIDYARAIDLCQTTTLNAVGASKTWGLISAELRLANGTGTPATQSHAIVQEFGSVLGPRKNTSFVLLSTGLAAAPGQPYWQFGTPEGGTDTGTVSPVPPGFPTNKAGCPLPFGSLAFNPTNLKLTVRVPTNAGTVAFDQGFYSAEYPEYACSTFNDLWVTLLTTGASGIANNKNILFDAQGTPGSVNLNFFDRCVAGPTGCFGGSSGFNFCSGGSAELAGTGYDGAAAPCGPPSSVGGGTGWLATEAPVVPGEVMVIEFVIWDSSDGIYDSASILDNFHWEPGTVVGPSTARP